MKTKTNVLIIGAGPIGIACALACKKNDLSYIVLEKGALTNSIYNYPLNMTFFSTSEKLELDHIPFISNSAKPNRNEALEYYRRVVTNNALNIQLFETAISVEKVTNSFTITSSKNTYKAEQVIVATGFYDIPKLLNIPGEDLPKVTHYYKEAHPYALQKTIVVGASNSAVDAALEIHRKGGDVTMVVRGPEIGERVKYWVRPDIINRIEEGSIKAYFNSELEDISEKEVSIKTPKGSITIANDNVIALTGYLPDFDFLKHMGIQISARVSPEAIAEAQEKNIPTYHPETMESNVPGLYLAGVICGGLETHKWFIENSRIHAAMIVKHITSN